MTGWWRQVLGDPSCRSWRSVFLESCQLNRLVNMILYHWLVVWNMKFIFHFIYGIIMDVILPTETESRCFNPRFYGGLTLKSQETKREIRAALKKIRRAPGEMVGSSGFQNFHQNGWGEMGLSENVGLIFPMK